MSGAISLDAASLESGEGRHGYFQGIAQARFVIRKCFRIVDEQARQFDLDPLEHQAMLQIYGSPEQSLAVSRLAERLDVSTAFASKLAKGLEKLGYAVRRQGSADQRVTNVAITAAGRGLLHKIDEQVRFHVGYFARQLSPKQRATALSIFAFYVGTKLPR
jgi:DNA-binding MarR family transcriptional regulator